MRTGPGGGCGSSWQTRKTIAVAGHYAVPGAVSGCVIGHHIATKAAREKAQQHPTSGTDYSDTPNSSERT